MAGQKCGSVTAIRETGKCSDGKAKWLFACDCGKEFEVSGSKVRGGEVHTCPSCSKERVRLARTKHGERQSVEYRTWTHIKSRCLNEKVPEFGHYGGRGITICERWIDSFENFLADMGKRPAGRYSIDRIDVDGNYEPSNCRWANAQEQQNNKRNNRKIAINGSIKNMAQWADENGLRHETVFKRIKRGKNGEDLIKESSAAEVIEFNGVRATIPEWSAKTGIKKATLYWRINTKQWPTSRALTEGAIHGNH